MQRNDQKPVIINTFLPLISTYYNAIELKLNSVFGYTLFPALMAFRVVLILNEQVITSLPEV